MEIPRGPLPEGARAKTHNRHIETVLPHGRSKYVNEGCRCDECKAANRDYFRQRRKK